MLGEGGWCAVKGHLSAKVFKKTITSITILLGEPITKELWDSTFEKINTCFSVQDIVLFNLKLSICLHSSVATHLHSYALCPKMYSLWCDVFGIMSEVMGTMIEADSIHIILGVSILQCTTAFHFI